MLHLGFFLLYFLAFFLEPVVAETRNLTLGFTNTNSILSFSVGWRLPPQVSGDPFFLFDNVGVTALIINLPPLASRVTYTGLGRTQGSLYGVCVDCNDDLTSVSVFDAHDPQLTDNSLATPVDIFSLSLDINKQHTITILNIPDSRFNNQSELTFIQIIITIGDVQTTTTTQTSTVTVSSSSNSLASTSSSSVFTLPSTSTTSSASSSLSAEPSNTSISSGTRTSIIAVIIILSLIGLGSLLLGLFFYRRRKVRRLSRMSQLPEKIRLQSQQSLKLPIMPASKATPRYGFETETPGPLASAGRSRPTTRLLDSGV